MATPTSGSISMLNMRSEITRGSGAISMSEVRTRYGGSGAISFSNLYAAEGFVVTCGQYFSKFFNSDGWYINSYGSVSPNESNGCVQVATGAFIAGVYDTVVAPTYVFLSGTSSATGDPAVGWRGTDIIRVVVSNTNQAFSGATNTTVTCTNLNMPASGTVHCLVQF